MPTDDLYEIGLLGESMAPKRGDTLSEKFLIPPFSVMSARDGFWQERKRAWLSIGIQSELGRGEALVGGSGLYSGKDEKYGNFGPRVAKVSPGGSPRPACDYSQRQRGDGAGRPIETKLAEATEAAKGALTFTGAAASLDFYRVKEGTREETTTTGTSIFDPVLCELAYRWFCPPGGYVLDPFAGGSVRGIVAARLGRHYTGVDLSAPQIEANRSQGETLCADATLRPVWHCGDSATIRTICPDVHADFLFSCPPYGSLEQYSDNPKDLSTFTKDQFNTTYAHIIKEALSLLKNDRFACFVVGDYRDKTGCYCNLPGVTIAAFAEAGARLYNYAILVTAVGSLPIRVSRQFPIGKKLGKTHQDILVFVKGDPKRAAEACNDA
jgi:hypothetical protein